MLLVEDEDQVRGAAAGILRRAGYTVLEARSPREALAICRAHDGRIDLVLTDIVMPGMNGRTLSREISELRPSVSTLYMSGYTDNVIQHHGVLAEGEWFLQKPFTPALLAQRVRAVLDHRSARETPGA
ncbi:MAG: response regulator [Polyangiales bacterium]